MKYCSHCEQTLPLDKFYHSKKNVSCYCKQCWKIKVTSKNKPNKQKQKEYSLKYRFGITLEQHTDLYTKQSGCCAICGKQLTQFAESTDLSSVACVDHNHTTGEVRGLLCNHCNTAIGLLQENPVILNNALSYLLERGVK